LLTDCWDFWIEQDDGSSASSSSSLPISFPHRFLSLSRLLPFQAPVLPLVLSMYVCVFVLFTTIHATTRTINDYHDNDDGASNLLAN